MQISSSDDIITIDGPSGSGKSTISKLLAARMNYAFLDTGAMYRAVGFKVEKSGIVETDSEALGALLNGLDLELIPDSGDTRVILDNEDISDAIRSAHMGLVASRVSAIPLVREKLTDLQRKLGAKGSVVTEGRDMGTVVFPDARHKFYLDASPEERARRRTEQLKEKGQHALYSEIFAQITKRDHDDSSRDLSPLKPAEDAIIIDSSKMGIDEVVSFMLNSIKHGGKLWQKTTGP